MTDFHTLRTWAEKLIALIRSVASRGKLRNVYEDRALRVVQVELPGGEILELEHAEPYGLTARPHIGADAVALFPFAVRAKGLMLSPPDYRYRIKFLAEGEVALYDDLGQVVHLKRDGVRVVSLAKVHVDAPLVELVAATKVDIISPLVTISGALQVTGLITGTGGVADALGPLAALRAGYNVHTHGETGGTTSPPVPTV